MTTVLDITQYSSRVYRDPRAGSASPLTLGIAGIGAWTHGAPDWPSLRAVLRGEHGWRDDAPAKPAAAILPAAERRRAPDSVLLATEIAHQACLAASCEPANLPCVFTSTQGELAITDYMCATLASAPRDLSPTKFHNSVHNAAVGYWTIAAQCTAGSSAVSAYYASFGAGLLEAVTLAMADRTPVLFAAYDVAATGPLRDVAHMSRAFGMALVLTPDENAGSRFSLALRPDTLTATAAPDCVADLAQDNPLTAHALAFLAALAGVAPARLTLPAASGLMLDMEVGA